MVGCGAIGVRLSPKARRRRAAIGRVLCRVFCGSFAQRLRRMGRRRYRTRPADSVAADRIRPRDRALFHRRTRAGLVGGIVAGACCAHLRIRIAGSSRRISGLRSPSPRSPAGSRSRRSRAVRVAHPVLRCAGRLRRTFRICRNPRRTRAQRPVRSARSPHRCGANRQRKLGPRAACRSARARRPRSARSSHCGAAQSAARAAATRRL